MADIIRPGQGVLYMKVGTHAGETLENIIERKTREIEEAGIALWGYGGGTCHPQTMVQPFAKEYERRGGTIYLCMEPMISNHFAEPVRADQYSVDGLSWIDIHESINVLGSRYALVIQDLRREDFELPLERTRVALGNSMGARGSRYISGRVDKACLEIAEETVPGVPERSVHIGLVANIVKPYAVYVRNKRR
ncbi:MAG TPA: hypothetical protein VN282_10255 [Pyrinomonadaceae bacterium]|nr:hypothetical protein [Pyrinomonadaceae bacterium]